MKIVLPLKRGLLLKDFCFLFRIDPFLKVDSKGPDLQCSTIPKVDSEGPDLQCPIILKDDTERPDL